MANKTTGDLTAILNDKLVGPVRRRTARRAASGSVRIDQGPYRRGEKRADQPADLLGERDQPLRTVGAPRRIEAGQLLGHPVRATRPVGPARKRWPSGSSPRSTRPKSTAAKAAPTRPFHVHIARRDGEQELKVVDVTLPKGLTGKLAGIPYCSEAAIAAAAASSGKAEQASPSCPAASLIGTATTKSGIGRQPAAARRQGLPGRSLQGRAALDGDDHAGGAGPVRPRHRGRPGGAQRRSGNRPDQRGLRRRSPTCSAGSSWTSARSTSTSIAASSCSTRRTVPRRRRPGTINGGGANPTNPAAFSSYAVNDPFQATECNKLGFKPKLNIQLYGATKRTKNPRLKAILDARKGDANIARTALTLPHSLFLDQSHIGTVCTRPQLASHTCPAASVYGTGGSEVAVARQEVEGQGLPGVLQQQIAGPGRRPARSGGDPAARRDRAPSTGGLKTVFTDGAGRAGEASSSST